MFRTTKILNPANVFILLNAAQKYKKISTSDMNLDIEALIMTIDYKDIDQMYFLMKRYQQTLEPALATLSNPAPSQPAATEIPKKNLNNMASYDYLTETDIQSTSVGTEN